MSGTHSRSAWSHALPDNLADGSSGDDDQTAEAQVERVLRQVAALSPEAQALLLSRLLAGLSRGVTPGAAGTAITEALSPAPGAMAARAATRGARSGRAEPTLESPLADMRDRFDPLEAWERFPDPERLLAVLRSEPAGILEAMLRHPRLPAGKAPRGKSAGALAACIVQRISAG